MSSDCLINNQKINGVGIGDPAEKIFSTFQSKYKIVDEKRPHSLRKVILYKENRLVIQFEITEDKNKILFISVYDNCVTNENIGIGSMLSDAVKVYGKGSISPADEGYLIDFAGAKGLSFLLDNGDIPKRLRNIPDDDFTKKQEKEIMNLKNVKIKSIKISGIY